MTARTDRGPVLIERDAAQRAAPIDAGDESTTPRRPGAPPIGVTCPNRGAALPRSPGARGQVEAAAAGIGPEITGVPSTSDGRPGCTTLS
ncbi:hypothetical protein Acsp06_18730 [Actinomycetospora sp. NBRC 106375]|uniref:hypothetical protein n=1 Tax=Actinomycetospora sp. NBRC 106375 TaxID=3032207 RepID=UPI0024A27D32|nr:hypothetical protein [Actinomycetospora sp. NBRC 106375]GLZ45688.1 hypothetical protein Acsp06_18730 [Actinomycetospora sp. NBRC 106375]